MIGGEACGWSAGLLTGPVPGAEVDVGVLRRDGDAKRGPLRAGDGLETPPPEPSVGIRPLIGEDGWREEARLGDCCSQGGRCTSGVLRGERLCGDIGAEKGEVMLAIRLDTSVLVGGVGLGEAAPPVLTSMARGLRGMRLWMVVVVEGVLGLPGLGCMWPWLNASGQHASVCPCGLIWSQSRFLPDTISCMSTVAVQLPASTSTPANSTPPLSDASYRLGVPAPMVVVVGMVTAGGTAALHPGSAGCSKLLVQLAQATLLWTLWV